MATVIKIGAYYPDPSDLDSDMVMPSVFIDNNVVQVLNDEDELVLEFTVEELKGIMAIIDSEKERFRSILTHKSKFN
jgi:hypothetical protein